MGTSHEFAGAVDPTTGESVGYNEACTPCHVPAGGTAASVGSRATVYQMYGRGSRAGGQPSGTSLVCLSCHDGTVGTHVRCDSEASLGTDLRNDHPISISYNPQVDGNLRASDFVTNAGLKLFTTPNGSTVECPICHNPHDNSRAQPFLRTSNDGSALCRICHQQ